MVEEQKYINVSIQRFEYISPIPTIRYFHKIGLYAPNDVFIKYYKTFSSHLDYKVVLDFKEGVINDDVISMMIYMSMSGDSDFSYENVLKNLENHKKLFYNCKIFTNIVSVSNLIIDPIKVDRYKYLEEKFGIGKFKMMNWIHKWCSRQSLGAKVYLFDNSYIPKIKGYLLGAGYDEISNNIFKKVNNPPKAKYIML